MLFSTECRCGRCEEEEEAGPLRVKGGKGNCPFLGALFGTLGMTREAQSGLSHGADLGFWTVGCLQAVERMPSGWYRHYDVEVKEKEEVAHL